MPRYYRRRYRTIVRAPKKKWCSNMREIELPVTNTDTTVTSVSNYMMLAENKSEISAPTPIVVKTGNFKLQADFYINFTGTSTSQQIAANAQLYIIYVPEGMTVNTYTAASNIVKNHPEWIMAWRYFDVKQGPINVNTLADGGKISMTSRLKRNLNSGDAIYAVLLVQSLPSLVNMSVRGMCQFWSCAN